MPARKRTTVRLDDAARMRVLAHPTRLELLGLLRERGPQTAALLGDVVDEAPGTVSYHLGKLAGAGLIEEAQDQGSDGRERWWRAAHESTSVDPAKLVGDPEKFASAVALERAFSQAWALSYDRFIDSLPQQPPEWAAAALATDRTLRLTVSQAAALRDELLELGDRWQEVTDANDGDPSAERVMLTTTTYRRP
ncbi:transcriptional regulator [Frondihabitans sucicola]|uniref:Transcriptional regulator n=1 Tax=Frondihabitans sucicola TaxID=1268041 RepID=A0ABM8GNA3_9MICO|nr:winged helix-turn-helix domain-containing protein [Frondihabitans sucicola]BDZ49901.1 transcriptional regulator [Frondihabitans sucicola]